MFIGHALLAFAVAALVAERWGWDDRNALLLGVVAGAFAAAPDADIAYALVGLVEWNPGEGPFAASTAFWDASRLVHRSVTHSLVVGALAAPAFGLVAAGVRNRERGLGLEGAAGATTLLALVAVVFVADGPLAAFVMGTFVVAGVLVAAAAARWTSLSPAAVALAALWGLWSHPWGDLVTGSPPDLLYPLEATPLSARVVLHPDPTLHLLGAFALELAVIWLALAAVCRLTDRTLPTLIDRRAVAGTTYGIVALAATPPTLEVSYHFVFSILGVGLVCGAIRSSPSLPPSLSSRVRSLRRTLEASTVDGALEAASTAMAAVTVALVTYAAVYASFVAT
ncbi:metal-dependent hydrolase [Natrialbaceae archaeon GCM10025810]|uniref:metal-dependent hydrolase n=1 Tax=Halovalidus salilacus TaxID=3075124 RepID=UPI00360814D1